MADEFQALTLDDVATAEGEMAGVDASPEVRDRARALVDTLGAEGAADMRALSRRMGIPVARVFLAEMIRHGPAAERDRLAALVAAIPDIGAAAGSGCVQIEFPTFVAYIMLDACGADHDLGAQLEKIYAHIPEAQQAAVTKHLSFLFGVGRTIYDRVVCENLALVTEIADSLPEGFNPRDVAVDLANTTMYLAAPCVRRVGLFVDCRKK